MDGIQRDRKCFPHLPANIFVQITASPGGKKIMEYTTSGWRKFNAIGGAIMFVIFLGLALRAEMRNGSPEIVNGVVTGYWHVDPMTMAVLWMVCAAFGLMIVLVMVWQGPVKGSIEYKAAKAAQPGYMQQRKKFCRECGAEVQEGWKVCPNCAGPLH